MKFFLDANMPYSSLVMIEELSFKVQHAKDVGLGKAPDKEIMNYAVKNRCVLITKDLEFGNTKIFPTKYQQGLIILRLPFYFISAKIVEVLKEFLSSINIADLEKALTIVKLGRYRIRAFTDSQKED